MLLSWGFINSPYLSQHDRFLAKLHGEPLVQKLKERVKYEWEHFEERERRFRPARSRGCQEESGIDFN